MTKPKFAPILPNVEVRDLHKLPVPPPWRTHRPADFRPQPGAGRKPGRGIAGPDQGYGLLLAERYTDKVRLGDGEHSEDVLAGAVMIALRRAAIFGRAPVAADIELALNLFGFLQGTSEEVVEGRRDLFRGVSHDYWRQRELADLVPESTLRLPPASVAEQLASDPSSFDELSGLDNAAQ